MSNLIFDFDGVIANTWEALVVGRMKIGTYVDREAAVSDMHDYFSRKPNHARGHKLTKGELLEMNDWVIRYGETVCEHGFCLFDDFVKEIEEVNCSNKAIVSSGSQNYVLPALSKTEINPTHILLFEDHHSKEEKIEQVCHDWGIPVSEAFYFTDTLADVYELQNLIAKDRLIGVSWGFSGKELLLTQLTSENILDTPKDLRRLLGLGSVS